MDCPLQPIALIYMGGTFGCIGQPLLPLPAEIFLPQLKTLLHANYPALKHFVASKNIRDSSQLQPQDWLDLLHQLKDLVQQGFYKILIVHGTDTLAYTAAFLAEFLNDVLPQQPLQLVITGSQYPLLEPQGHDLNSQSDALANLQLAYQQLCSSKLQADKVACWVAFDGHVWPAHAVQKIHTASTPTFAGNSQALVSHMPAPANLKLEALADLNIAVYYALPLSPEIQAQQLQQLLVLKPQAIIILAFGAGNLAQHAAIENLLQQAQLAQVLLVLSTQVAFGGVNFTYAAGHWLGQFGVLSAGNWPLAAIYARLAWLCCQSLSFESRQQQWQQRLTP